MEFFNSFVDKGLLDRLHNILDNEFGRVTYTEAVELLKKSGHTFEYPVEWGIDLQTEHERYLTDLQKACIRNRLPRRNQGVLYASE